MDALKLLTERYSEKKLSAPAPNKDQLAQIFQAALHAPDHGKLHPYRFVVIEEDKMATFGDLLKSAVDYSTVYFFRVFIAQAVCGILSILLDRFLR